MNPTLEAVLHRLGQEGPINLHVDPDEYEALKGAVRVFWPAYCPWTQAQRDLLLVFLRGYTFYREISENEGLFWLSLERELGVQHVIGQLQGRQYDEIWDALGSHPEVADLRLRGADGRREAVRTIARVWGYQVLRASKLLQLFNRYYNTCPGEEITPQLMRVLDPQDRDDLVRQARVFDRLFRQMVQVVDYLLDHDKTMVHLPAAELMERLQEGGLVFETPNPVLYFSHKSRTALAQLVGEVEGGTRRRYRMRKPVARIVTPHPYVLASLAEGLVMAHQPFTIEVPKAGRTQGLNLKLDSGQTYPVENGKAEIDGLEEGEYQGAVTLYGALTGSTITFRVLPHMEWTLTSTPETEPVLEGQWQAGRVTLADGRFGVFRWCPRWQYTQRWEPPVQTLPVSVDDVAVTLDVKAESYGARIAHLQSGKFLDELHDPSMLGWLMVSPLVPRGRKEPEDWRAYFESQPSQAVDLGESLLLAALSEQVPYAHDRLIVEFSHREQQYRACTLPILFEPKIREMAVADGFLTMCVDAPLRSAITIRSRQRKASLHLTITGRLKELKVPLEPAFGWTMQTLEVTLTSPGSADVATEIAYTPGMRRATLLKSALGRGVGWLPLK